MVYTCVVNYYTLHTSYSRVYLRPRRPAECGVQSRGGARKVFDRVNAYVYLRIRRITRGLRTPWFYVTRIFISPAGKQETSSAVPRWSQRLINTDFRTSSVCARMTCKNAYSYSSAYNVMVRMSTRAHKVHEASNHRISSAQRIANFRRHCSSLGLYYNIITVIVIISYCSDVFRSTVFAF